MKKRLFFLGIAICFLLSGRGLAQTVPTASFSLSQASVCVGGTIQVTDQSTDMPILWTYTIDGTSTQTSTLQSPVLTFTASGVYSISLISENGNGPSSVYTETVMAFALPNVTAGSSVQACAGETVVLSGSGASSYAWTGGITNGVPFTPIATTIYTVTGTDGNGCMNTASQTVVVNPLPTVSVTSGAICAGDSFTLNPTGANTYTYSGGTNIVSPTSNTSYTVNGKDVNGCINTAVSTVTVDALPVISANSGAICEGNSFVITPSGAISYTSTGGSLTVNPATTTSYSITGTDANGCISSSPAVATVTVNALPVISASNGSICQGNSFSITPSGASTYTITGGSFNVSPSTNTSYSVTGTSVDGCVSSAATVINITVNSLPVISVNSGTICAGDNFTLNPSGATTYTYSGGANIVSPSSTTSYTVIGEDMNGCINTAIAEVTVHALPVVFVNTGAICSGDSFTIVPSGATSYVISGGSFVVSPLSNTSYSVTGTSAEGCPSSNVAISDVTVNPIPTLSVSSGTICIGQSFVLSPSGAATYTFSSGSAIVSPTTNTAYSIIGTSAEGCVTSGSVLCHVIVNTLPVVSVSSGSICAGDIFTITLGGAISYSVSGGSATVTPVTTTSYSVIGEDANGCVSPPAIATVTVSNVNLTITGNTGVCLGETTTLTVSGANTYTWDSGTTTSSIVITPTATVVYTINATNADGCSNSETVTVNSFSLPIVSISPASPMVCVNSPVSFTATGANSYLWNGTTSGSSAVFTPAANSTYTVIGTSSDGCTSTATVAVVTYSLPVIGISPSLTVCPLASTSFTASGAITYTWNNNNSLTGDTFTDNPAASTIYTVEGTDAQGCSSTATVAVNTMATPPLVVTPIVRHVCPGAPATFTASGAQTYTWSNSVVGNVISIIPATNTVAYVVGTGVNGCTTTVQFAMVLRPLPSISISPVSATVCQNTPKTFTAFGATTYTWSTGTIGNMVTLTPASNSIYTVTGTGNNSCINSQTVSISTLPAPAVSINPSSSSVCALTYVNLQANGALTYTWSTGNVAGWILVSPSVSSTYTVTGKNIHGCVSSATVNINVWQLPVISVSAPSTTVCAKDMVTLTASGANTYTWYPYNVNGSTYTSTPATTITHYVHGIDNNGCTNSDSITVYVNKCTGIVDNNETESQISVYPNPSTGFITIQFGFEGEKEIIITNAVGAIVGRTSTSNNEQNIDLSSKASGIYYIQVNSKTSSFNHKVLIQ
jgi:hypothetical protein